MSERRGGPRTPLGKYRSSRNSYVHGLFARAFDLTIEEKKEYEEIRQKFREGLKPDNPALELIFEDLVACFYRMKIALHHEGLALRKDLTTTEESKKVELSLLEEKLTFPYKLSPREIRLRLRFLEEIKPRLLMGVQLGDELKQGVREAFGDDFTNLLTLDFQPESVAALNAAMMSLEYRRWRKQWEEQGETYSSEVPEIEPLDPAVEADLLNVDVQARMDMRGKLVDLEHRHLFLALHHVEQGQESMSAAANYSRLDRFLRYATTARRDFYKTLHHYFEIRGQLT
jgi:hypothetical protein